MPYDGARRVQPRGLLYRVGSSQDKIQNLVSSKSGLWVGVGLTTGKLESGEAIELIRVY